MLDTLACPDDLLLAQQCLEHQQSAIACLQKRFANPLTRFLLHFGASAAEAGEIINDLWGDCLSARSGRRPRLASYAGNSPLEGWLKVVALNIWIDRKRRDTLRQRVFVDEPCGNSEAASENAAEPVAEPQMLTDEPLLKIITGAVQAAFAQCTPEDFVLLQLAHANGLFERELARMFSCSTSTISRDLEEARARFVAATLAFVKAQDPWLDLKWDDFVELLRVVGPECFGIE